MQARVERHQTTRPQSRAASIKRTNSATTNRWPMRSTSTFSENRRSNSARLSKIEPPVHELEIEESEEVENQEEHKIGCPWRKARSQSKSRLGIQQLNSSSLSSGIVHPKPWGARNPKEIPCFCRNINKKQEREKEKDSMTRVSKSPTRMQDMLTRQEKMASKTKANEIIASFCTVMDRKKIKVTDFEINYLTDTLKEKLQKYKETTKPPEEPPKAAKQLQPPKGPPRIDKSPLRRPKTAQSQAMTSPPLQPVHAVVPLDMGEPPTRHPTGPVLGKVETKKYYLELRADEEVPQGLKQMFGMMQAPSHDKQFVLMEGSANTFVQPEYAVMNSGMQLRHHEENTMLLLGHQRPAAPRSPSRHVPALLPAQLPGSKSRRP